MYIFFRFGIGATIRIGQETQCLPYQGFSPFGFILWFVRKFEQKSMLKVEINVEGRIHSRQKGHGI